MNLTNGNKNGIENWMIYNKNYQMEKFYNYFKTMKKLNLMKFKFFSKIYKKQNTIAKTQKKIYKMKNKQNKENKLKKKMKY